LAAARHPPYVSFNSFMVLMLFDAPPPFFSCTPGRLQTASPGVFLFRHTEVFPDRGWRPMAIRPSHASPLFPFGYHRQEARLTTRTGLSRLLAGPCVFPTPPRTGGAGPPNQPPPRRVLLMFPAAANAGSEVPWAFLQYSAAAWLLFLYPTPRRVRHQPSSFAAGPF